MQDQGMCTLVFWLIWSILMYLWGRFDGQPAQKRDDAPADRRK